MQHIVPGSQPSADIGMSNKSRNNYLFGAIKMTQTMQKRALNLQADLRMSAKSSNFAA